MATFGEANQVKYSLKMRLINYSWFKAATVVSCGDGYEVIITTSKIDNSVKKIVSPVLNGINVKLELE
jgi:hypothetical protein